MLGLKLRQEFQGIQMPDTTISLTTHEGNGAAERDAEFILSITYPTSDVQAALKAITLSHQGRPLVLKGSRGRGKSHIMAVLHHAVTSPDKVESWARDWGERLGVDSLRQTCLPRGFAAITQALHEHEYATLWDLIFDRHPEGKLYRKLFEESPQRVPQKSRLVQMFKDQPTVLILDEFQKWFDDLQDEPGDEGAKQRNWATTMIQLLAEIGQEYPERLILIVSLLNNDTTAFDQIHRNYPVLVDFNGTSAQEDRRNLLLYRLFANRGNFPNESVSTLSRAYGQERYRLRFSHLAASERSRIEAEVTATWPFSPELLDLLDNQVLMADAAQNTRDMIRILAELYRSRGAVSPVLTAADFLVDDETSGVDSLMTAISSGQEQEKLLEIARRELRQIEEAAVGIPMASELISALWVHTLSPLRSKGITRQELQLSVTRESALDDNEFRSDLNRLTEASTRIHGEESAEGRLYLDLPENPRSKVKATARNEYLWAVGSGAPAANTYPGEDIKHIQRTLRHMLASETREMPSRPIVLGPKWRTAPWTEVEEKDAPGKWEQPVVIVIPEALKVDAAQHVDGLGKWLAAHVPARRNTVRFLLPKSGTAGLYQDKELGFLSRCSYLTSIAWNDPTYRPLKDEFDKPFRAEMRNRFERFATLHRWNFSKPDECVFETEAIAALSPELPSNIEKSIRQNFYSPNALRALVVAHAEDASTIGALLDELLEPPSVETKDAIPYLGERDIYNEVLKLAAKGAVWLNLNGKWIGRKPEHESDEAALQQIQSRAYLSIPEMRGTQLTLRPPATESPVIIPTLANRHGGQTPQPKLEIPGGDQGGGTAKDQDASPNSDRDVTTGAADENREVRPSLVSRTKKTESPNLGVNLSHQLELWGVEGGRALSRASITFNDLTTAQLKAILSRIPTSQRANLEIAYLEEETQ